MRKNNKTIGRISISGLTILTVRLFQVDQVDNSKNFAIYVTSFIKDPYSAKKQYFPVFRTPPPNRCSRYCFLNEEREGRMEIDRQETFFLQGYNTAARVCMRET